MKKVIFLLLSLVMLNGCYISNETQPRNKSRALMYAEPKIFEFNNHEYIYFYTIYGDVVHNPDCPCKNNTK
jgi:hypothetical protein